MKTNRKKIIVLLFAFISVLFALALALSLSFAYYGRNRKFNGTLTFSNGVKLNYYNAQEESANSFSLLKLGNKRTIDSFEDVSDLTPLNESADNVKSEEVFYLANPYLKSNAESIDCFVRFKLEIRTVELASSRNMTDNELLNVFGKLSPFEYNLVSDENAGFLKKGDYYYLVNSGTAEIEDYSDLLKLENSDETSYYLFNSENFKTASVSGSEDVDVYYYELKLAETVDYYLVTNFEIVITIETIDGRDGSEIQTADVWQIIE